MTRLAFLSSMLASVTGLGLLFPASPSYWPTYSRILIIHMGVGLLLSLLMIGVVFTHVRTAIRHTSKGQTKRDTGIGYFVVICLTIGSGLFMSVRSGFAISWVLPLHLIAGGWCAVMGWKHSMKKKVKTRLL